LDTATLDITPNRSTEKEQKVISEYMAMKPSVLCFYELAFGIKKEE
jgi:hypothetical protein